MKIKELKEIIKLPEHLEINLDKGIIKVKGHLGECQREFYHPKINISIKDKQIIISAKDATKREKKMIGTFKSHIKNLIKGVTEGYVYKLKICNEHFPMNVSIENNNLVVKNFLGEKIPRKAKILDNVDVKIEGDIIIVSGIDKEKVGQTAANIEGSVKITKRDRHKFMDGIWITEKGGKTIK